jgi:hypothetical protein
MKRMLFFLFFACLFSGLSAQEAPDRSREIGIAFSGLNHYGLVYRTGQDNKFWRFNVARVDLATEKDDFSAPSSSTNLSGFLRAGKEVRKPLSEKLDWRFGADLSIGGYYSLDKTEGSSTVTNWSLRPGANLVLGLNFKIGKHLLLGAELLPGISYSFGKYVIEPPSGQSQQVTKISDIIVGINNYGALLSLVSLF